MTEEAQQGELGLEVEDKIKSEIASPRLSEPKKDKIIKVQPSFRLITENKDGSSELDVPGRYKEYIKVLKAAENLDPNQRITYLKENFIYKYLGRLRRPKVHDTLENDEGGSLEDFEIEMDNFLQYADNTILRHGSLTGKNIGIASHGVHLDGVVVISNEGFAGSTISSMIHDLRGNNDLRSIDCEFLVAQNSVFTGGNNIGRNVKGGILTDCLVDSPNAFTDAWGGFEFRRVVIRGQNGDRPINKKFPLERTLVSRQKREDAPVTHRFIGGNTFVPKKPIR